MSRWLLLSLKEPSRGVALHGIGMSSVPCRSSLSHLPLGLERVGSHDHASATSTLGYVPSYSGTRSVLTFFEFALAERAFEEYSKLRVLWNSFEVFVLLEPLYRITFGYTNVSIGRGVLARVVVSPIHYCHKRIYAF